MAVTTQVLIDRNNWYVVRLTNLDSGAAGEAAVKKVDMSTLTGPDGVNAPISLSLYKAQWAINGFEYVALYWDATTDDAIALLTGHDSHDWTDVGGIPNPLSTGATGDVMLTCPAGAATDTYDLTLEFRKKNI
jgi:hypothetical protein